MFRRIQLFIFLWFLALNSHAQFLAGPKGAFHIYDVHYPNKENQQIYDPKIDWGYKFGIMSYFPLISKFSLNWDFLFASRGRNVKMGESSWRLEETHYYLEFPLMLTLNFETKVWQLGPFRRLGPFTGYFGVGPNMSYWLNGYGTLNTNVLDHKYTIKFSPDGGDVNYLYIEPANRFQWGLDLAMGLFSPMTNNSELVTELRCTIGHTNLGFEGSSYMPILGFEDNLESNYRTITLSAAYLFYWDPGSLRKGKSTGGVKIKAKRIGGPEKKRKSTNRKTSEIKAPRKKVKNINKID